ncbi:MAG: prolyl oligopeptidase family serine peptidase [Bacteroidia bacterium]|nr:prolyl oligopeptidase family serine peptidase [Bacteroidia bacterium]
MNYIKLLFLILLMGLMGCNTQSTSSKSDKDSFTVSFKDREINLTPYVEGFPYSRFMPVLSANKLFYMHRGQTTKLMMLPLNDISDLSKGKVISDINFDSRNVFSMRYNEADGHLYWSGDEINDEVINLYQLNIDNGEVKKLTDVPYIFGWRWNPQGNKVAYIARLGDKENRLGELRVLDLENGKEEKIIQDRPEMRFTWGSPSWHPEGKGVLVNGLKDASRTYGNLLYVDFAKKESKLLTDQNKARYFPAAYEEWIDNDRFLYFSNEDGFTNAYTYDWKKGESRQITSFTKNLGNPTLIEIEGEKRLFATTSNPIATELYTIDLDGKIIESIPSEVNIGVLDHEYNELMISTSSNKSLFSMQQLTVEEHSFSFNKVLDLPENLKSQLYQSEVERIEYPTFDTDPKTGEARKLHAYLYKPKNPLPKDEQMVMIQSFYGGGNNFSNRYQIMAEAGIYVLSPSPRGSSGFGKEFFALNDKDLGGNEIIDIFYAAKYISEKLGIPPSRIGVFGGSHGGYATMRVLTFPGEINGNKADFDWGFGMSHAGFSDIVHFYENCNIPDWVTLEAGDPKTEGEKLRDRSPLYHADKMKGKLLLTHGTNDSRVPIEGSRWMRDSLMKYEKDVTLVEFEGQGHGIKGLENTKTFYQAWLGFLEKVGEKDEKM